MTLTDFNHAVTAWCNAQDVSAGARNVLRILAYKASIDGWSHFYGIGKMATWSRSPLARKLGIRPVTRQTIHRHLAELERLELVSHKQRHRPGRGQTSNEYVFRFDRAYIGGTLHEFDFKTGTVGWPIGNVTAVDQSQREVSAGEPLYDCDDSWTGFKPDVTADVTPVDLGNVTPELSTELSVVTTSPRGDLDTDEVEDFLSERRAKREREPVSEPRYPRIDPDRFN